MNTGFLEWLRLAAPGEGRGNDEVLRAFLPLMRQALAAHEAGQVAPLAGVDPLSVTEGVIWFRADQAIPPTINRRALQDGEGKPARAVEVVGESTITVELGVGVVAARTHDVQELGAPVLRPVFLPGYTTWEHEVGHHDALTDIFSLGMLLASATLGADFTESEELRRFVANRHALAILHPTLHPVIARAIVRMTEPDRHRRAQDLPGLIDRLARYREVDERADREVDFRRIEGFLSADRSSRRKIIQAHLQARLFDVSKRNRLIWFKPTQQMLDLTIASVPMRLAIDTIRPEELFVWDGPGGAELVAGKPLDLDRYVRFEEAPWVRGVLDQIRAEDARQLAELGFSELKLVVAFLNWHNLKGEREERIRSPLLLLPVTLVRKRGVRDTYVVEARSGVAEVNPVLRHFLHELYRIELPEFVDLAQTDLTTLHAALRSEITRSEPGIALQLLTRPQIRVATERARRRLEAWRRRSTVTGRGISRHEDVDFSYSVENFHPLGLQLYRQLVKPEALLVEEHLLDARPVAPPIGETPDDSVIESERRVWSHAEEAGGPMEWAVDLTHCTLGNFNSRKMSLVRDYGRMLDEAESGEHPAFDMLFSPTPRAIEAPPAPGGDPFDTFAVVPADPTQSSAIRWARTGRDFIIQGPPGTGKSQTITNLIADFAARGKRVLFVCQKRAALDVVYHRLAEHGLDEISVLIHDSQADKRPFLEELKQTYEAWSAPAEPNPVGIAEARRRALLERMREPLEAIAVFSRGMIGPVRDGAATVMQVLGERLATKEVPGIDASVIDRLPPHGEWQTHRASVHAAGRALTELGASPILAALPLRHLSRAVLEAPQPLGVLLAGLDRLTTLVQGARRASQVLGPDISSAALADALAFANELEPLLSAGQLTLLDPDSAGSTRLRAVHKQWQGAARQLAKLAEATVFWRERLPREDAIAALAQARAFDALFFLFRWLSPAWWRLRAAMLARYDLHRHAVRPGFAAVLEALVAEQTQAQAVAEIVDEAGEEFGIREPIAALTKRVEHLRAKSGRSPLQIALIARCANDVALVRALLGAQDAIHALGAEAGAVFEGGAGWPLDDLATCLAETRSAAGLLGTMLGPLRALSEVSPTVRAAVLDLPFTAEQFDGAVAQASLARTYQADPGLARFTGATLGRRQAQLRGDVERWLGLNGETVRERVRTRFQAGLLACGLAATQLTTEQKGLKKTYNAGRRVLEREFQKVVRHRSIRELTAGDTGTVVYDLKPIWLMSPLSISDTIPLDEQRFDVVIFDEASQIPLEEAVPAVYRAPQMIVVGDEMQLPPTTFFATSREDDAPEEGDAHYDLEAESFLAHAALKLPSTMLGWHYRSRSEALIRFSNEAFYRGRLWTVPDRTVPAERPAICATAPDGERNAPQVLDRAISFHHLTDGVYAQRRNGPEAHYIAGLVRGLLGSGLTIGVVAFSEAQQSEIERALEQLAEGDPAFRRLLEAEVEREDDGQLVGLFIKNLENVQGDERDIILLSICYGPDPAGRMVMNFGPINKGGGEKRLNVVFSRAKRHMAVVSSITHTAIHNHYNEGAACFRKYLAYAEAMSRGDTALASIVMRSVAPTEAVAPPPSLAAATLQWALEDRGWEVEPNVGSSRFRVDLAVRDPAEGSFTVAVILDSPEAHAHPNAFETWHLRPSVLRAFGWRVVHILLRDLVAGPDACVVTIEAALRGEPEAEASPAPAPTPDTVGKAPAAPPPADAPALPLSGLLSGKTVLITGALTNLSRLDAEAAIREAGGRVARAASRSVDFVVVGDRPGSKLVAARHLGLREIDEAGLAGLLGSEVARQ